MAMLCTALLANGPAYAQSKTGTKSSEEHRRARQLAREARKAYDGGRFERAEGLIRGAYALDPAPALLYNLAAILDAKGDAQGALQAYQQFLRQKPAASGRRRIERRIEVLKRALKATPAPVKPAVSPPPPNPAAVVSSPTEVQPPERSTRILPWITAGTGALGVGAGVVLGVMAQSKQNDARNADEQLVAARALSDAESLATTANILYAAGGAVLVGGLIWGLLGGEAEPKVSAVIAPDFVGAVGRF
ncbi:MAG: hypothetical protein AAF449_11875 [Myxococcota bacterium]